MIGIFEKFSNKYINIDEIYKVESAESKAEKIAVRVAINRLISKKEIFACGRGIYGIFSKSIFTPRINVQSKNLIDIMHDKFSYLDFIISDTSFLSEFMNLQPFSSVLVVETLENAIAPVISALKNVNMTAYEKKDYQLIERYLKGNQIILIRPQILSSPTPIKITSIKFAGLEKILVDLVKDENIFGQYQGTELENIYQNTTEKYAVNYSRLLKYAKARNRRDECIALLETTEEYPKIKDLL
jgi:hypothetical protein